MEGVSRGFKEFHDILSNFKEIEWLSMKIIGLSTSISSTSGILRSFNEFEGISKGFLTISSSFK